MATVTAHTEAGNDRADNEDWYMASDGLVVVLDGATIRTGTGCSHGLPWYVRKLGAAITTGAQDFDHDLKKVLANAISHVAALHTGTCDLDHPGTPSAAVGIVRSGVDTTEWLVLGDVTIMIEDLGRQVTAVSDERVSQTALAERRAADQHLIGSPEKAEALVEMKKIELASRNRDDGYWIAAADSNAAEHAQVGDIPRSNVRRFAVCSDGAMRATTMTTLTRPASVLNLLRSGGPKRLIEWVRAAERKDPLGGQNPRNKTSDDATAVYVDMAVKTPGPARTEDASSELVALGAEPALFGACPTVDGRVL